MALTHKIVQRTQYYEEGSVTQTVTTTFEDTADSAIKEIFEIAASTTDLALGITVDVSEVQLLMITADAAITLETNDGGSPVDTLTVDASNPIVWRSGETASNPLTTDVTEIYATTSGSIVKLTIRILYDR